MSITRRIRESRQAKGLTPTALAKALGVSSTAAWNWDHDHTTPRPAMQIRIAKVLGVDPLYLASGVTGRQKSAKRTTTEVLEEAKADLSAIHGVPLSKVRLEFTIVG